MLLIMQYFPASFAFFFIQNTLVSTLFSSTFELPFFLRVKNQAPHPYKVTSKVLLFYQFICNLYMYN
jgi:hypothetical protein